MIFPMYPLKWFVQDFLAGSRSELEAPRSCEASARISNRVCRLEHPQARMCRVLRETKRRSSKARLTRKRFGGAFFLFVSVSLLSWFFPLFLLLIGIHMYYTHICIYIHMHYQRVEKSARRTEALAESSSEFFFCFPPLCHIGTNQWYHRKGLAHLPTAFA